VTDACHAWLLIRTDARTRTYRCVACGELLVLPRVLPEEEE
jgi:hypothetical protein